jgi:hypothetical protein
MHYLAYMTCGGGLLRLEAKAFVVEGAEDGGLKGVVNLSS